MVQISRQQPGADLVLVLCRHPIQEEVEVARSETRRRQMAGEPPLHHAVPRGRKNPGGDARVACAHQSTTNPVLAVLDGALAIQCSRYEQGWTGDARPDG